MKNHITILSSAMAVLVLSCGKQEPAREQADGRVLELQAAIGVESRASVSPSGISSWTGNDAISVYTSAGAIRKMELVSVTDGVGSFAGSFAAGETPQTVAVFPSGAFSAIAGNTVTVTYPSTYDYVEDAMQAPMAAAIDGGMLHFRNLGALVSIPCSSVPENASKFFIAATGKRLSGNFEVTLSDEMQVTAPQMSGNSKVTVSFENDGAPKTFNIPVPAGEYASIYAAFTDAEGHKISEWEVLKDVTVSRADMFVRPRPEGMMRLIGYNIRFSYNESSYSDGDGRKWAERRLYAPAAIAARYPDVMGTQENTFGQINDIVSGGLHGFAWCGRSNHGGSYSPSDYSSEVAAIYYRRGAVSLVENGTFWYSRTPDVPSRESGVYNMRCCNWAKLSCSDRVFYIFNTHLQVNSDTDDTAKWTAKRVEQANAVLDRIKELSDEYPVIMTGDFNTTADTENDAVDMLLKEGTLKDSRTLVTNPHGSTGTLNYFKSAAATRRIDYILVNDKVRVHSYWADNTQQSTGNWESDHNPVVVDISFE